MISLAGLLTTRRWPGRGSWVTGSASAAGRETAPSVAPLVAGSGVGAGGRAPGRGVGRRARNPRRSALTAARRQCRCRRRRRCLFGLDGAPQSFSVRLAPSSVGLRVLYRRGVTLHADPEADAKVEGFLVGQPQLTGKLVDADFLGQLVVRSSPITGRRSVRDPEPSAAPHSHTTPVTRTPALILYGRGLDPRAGPIELVRFVCMGHDHGMRILSLLPSATEIVYALGLEEDLVGVTHECDWPPAARTKRQVSFSALPPALEPAEVDRLVSASLGEGEPIYRLDREAVRELRPELVLTQDLCAVCAVPSGQVNQALEVLGCSAEVVSMDPSSLDEVIDCLLRVGAVTGTEARATALVRRPPPATRRGRPCPSLGRSGLEPSHSNGPTRRSTAGTGCPR